MPDHDYIPGGNMKFNIWQSTFTQFADSYKAGWGLSSEAIDSWNLLTDTASKKKQRWDAAWAIVSSKNCTRSDRVELKMARKDYERGFRSDPNDIGIRTFIARYIRYNPKVTLEQKKAMGLTLPGDFALPTAEAIANSEDIQIMGSVVAMKHLVHKSIIRSIGSKNRAKGKGISGIQVYIGYTEAKVKECPPFDEFRLDNGTVFYGAFTKVFKEEHEGLRAWYYARKVVKRKKIIYGPPSKPWSALVS